jgi:hypothetical protein
MCAIAKFLYNDLYDVFINCFILSLMLPVTAFSTEWVLLLCPYNMTITPLNLCWRLQLAQHSGLQNRYWLLLDLDNLWLQILWSTFITLLFCRLIVLLVQCLRMASLLHRLFCFDVHLLFLWRPGNILKPLVL